MQPQRHRFLFLLALAAVACGSEGGGGAPGATPAQGSWFGESVEFQLVDGELRDLRVKGAACTGTTDSGKICGAKAPGMPAPGSLAIEGGSVSGVLVDDRGFRLEIVEATFVSSTRLEGRWRLTSRGCCSVEKDFVAELEQPLAGPDTTSSPDAALGPDAAPVVQPCPAPLQGTPFGGCAPASATERQVTALEEVNRIRSWLDLRPVDEHQAINKATQGHCACYVQNPKVYQGGMSPHEENPSLEGCVAQNFWERMSHFGYEGNPSGEIMAFMNSPRGSVRGWVETLYHRIPIVDPDSFETGYGGARANGVACDTMDFATHRGGVDRDQVVLYPFDGQTGVATHWAGLESPQPPLPPGASYPSGPIITATVPGGVKLAVAAHKLQDAFGQEIPSQLQTPANDDNLGRTVSVYALAPLQPNTVYTVGLVGEKSGKEWAILWSFTTGTGGYDWDYTLPAP